MICLLICRRNLPGQASKQFPAANLAHGCFVLFVQMDTLATSRLRMLPGNGKSCWLKKNAWNGYRGVCLCQKYMRSALTRDEIFCFFQRYLAWSRAMQRLNKIFLQ